MYVLAHRYATHVFAITGGRLHFFSEIFFFINSLLSVLPRHLREATWKHFKGIRRSVYLDIGLALKLTGLLGVHKFL